MSHPTLAPVFAFHDTQASGVLPLLVFLGIAATAAWLLFSRLQWRNTVIVAVAAWAVGLVAALVV